MTLKNRDTIFSKKKFIKTHLNNTVNNGWPLKSYINIIINYTNLGFLTRNCQKTTNSFTIKTVGDSAL